MSAGHIVGLASIEKMQARLVEFLGVDGLVGTARQRDIGTCPFLRRLQRRDRLENVRGVLRAVRDVTRLTTAAAVGGAEFFGPSP